MTANQNPPNFSDLVHLKQQMTKLQIKINWMLPFTIVDANVVTMIFARPLC